MIPTRDYEEDESRKTEKDMSTFRKMEAIESANDAKQLDAQRYQNIRDIMGEAQSESPSEAKGLPHYEGDDAEAKYWNTEKEAIEALRDSPTGRGVEGREIIQQMYEPSNPSDSPASPLNYETGKVLTDEREPGVSTHIHRHEEGVTISVKDENAGKVERYNFNSGEGFEKHVKDMTPQEQERRMRSHHTQDNPNPDRDTIPGFQSSIWTKRENDHKDVHDEE